MIDLRSIGCTEKRGSRNLRLCATKQKRKKKLFLEIGVLRPPTPTFSLDDASKVERKGTLLTDGNTISFPRWQKLSINSRGNHHGLSLIFSSSSSFGEVRARKGGPPASVRRTVVDSSAPRRAASPTNNPTCSIFVKPRVPLSSIFHFLF